MDVADGNTDRLVGEFRSDLGSASGDRRINALEAVAGDDRDCGRRARLRCPLGFGRSTFEYTSILDRQSAKEQVMKLLVYGAGNIGSLYAAKLIDAGHDVTILARGARLQEIREQGILLQDFHSGQEHRTQIEVVEQLASEDAYDLVFVILPRSSVSAVLPILAANRNTPNIMFFGNNAGGFEEMTEALGRDRVLSGFPGAAAVPRDGHIRYVVLDPREQPTTMGELDGVVSNRIKSIAAVFESAGFSCSISENMDAWLKTHAAEIVPTANAFYMAGSDIGGLRHNREALGLMFRAIQEGHRVLSALDISVTPSSHRIFRWIPEFLFVVIARRKLADQASSIKIGHAAAARDEMNTLADEFHGLARMSGVPTPATNQLRKYCHDCAEQMV